MLKPRLFSSKSANQNPTYGRLLAKILAHIAIARPDHWFKNIFMLPGAALAVVLSGKTFGDISLGAVAIGILATSLIASANYTINEFLDANFDRHHPEKKWRPAALGQVSAIPVYTQWGMLAVAGLALGASLNILFFFFVAALLVMGLAYNVKPFRTKDRQYLDVLTESINNPLRFMLGWASVISDSLPPSSVLIAYWMGGAYLMAIKRYAEYRFIADPKCAGLYRRSFQFYTEGTLLISAFFYALSAAFFLGIFLIKYRIEFLLAVPFLSLLFSWYLKIGMRTNSVTQKPEKLYREKFFMLYVVFLGVLIASLFIVDLPWLNIVVERHVLSRP